MRGFGQVDCSVMPPAAGTVWCPAPGGGCMPVFGSVCPAGTATSAVLSNVSRPGQSFQVGDQWSLVISGDAGEAVTGSASQNGASVSSSNFGTTNESGQLTLGGTFGAGDVGTWSEVWQVGTGAAYPVSFTVSAVSSSTPPANVSQPVGPATAVTAPAVDLSFLSNSVSLFGFNIPVWGLIAAGAGILLLSKD
jgi:hypothetical protein